MLQLISNFHCREQMAQQRPIYKTTEVGGHFSVGSLLPPVSSSRKIRLFLFKNILSLLLKKRKETVGKPEKRQNIFLFLRSHPGLILSRELGKRKHPSRKPLQTTKLWIESGAVVSQAGLGHGETQFLPWGVDASQERELLPNKEWMSARGVGLSLKDVLRCWDVLSRAIFQDQDTHFLSCQVCWLISAQSWAPPWELHSGLRGLPPWRLKPSAKSKDWSMQDFTLVNFAGQGAQILDKQVSIKFCFCFWFFFLMRLTLKLVNFD